jgi:hypothetical protein
MISSARLLMPFFVMKMHIYYSSNKRGVWCLDWWKEMMDSYKDGKVCCLLELNNIFLYGAI